MRPCGQTARPFFATTALGIYASRPVRYHLPMLILKCSACRRKLWKYYKLGQGEVHRCHKDRIKKVWNMEERDGKVFCPCGKAVGIDRGSYFAMDKKAFTYKGTKSNS